VTIVSSTTGNLSARMVRRECLMGSEAIGDLRPRRVRCAVALHVEEQVCDIWSDGTRVSIGFASLFPSPRARRVSPGHLLAVATAPDGRDVAIWRWYDAVVLDHDETGLVRLWEPAHGDVVAKPRASYRRQQPGTRAYISAGLPGADWWVAAQVSASPDNVEVDLDAVCAMYEDTGLWVSALSQSE
jgi:hypothetical protein